MTHITQLKRLGLFDAKVPRYTSYPSAPHFNDRVDGHVFSSWISSLPTGTSISLYVHIPFCRRLCWFCACRTQGIQNDNPITGYIARIEAELAHVVKYLPQGTTLTHLHWGGGTPTILSPDHITRLATSIQTSVPFAPNYTFSVEIDPNELDAPRVNALVRAGMNRASIGVQDFDPEIQSAIGRPQGFGDTKIAIDLLREHGISSINADIVYGLPKQNKRRLTDTVQKLVSLTPERIALYGYAHVPWMARRQNLIDADTLPSPTDRLELFNTAQNLLNWDGYTSVGIDHFALPDDSMSKAVTTRTLRRNFQGYTVDPAVALIGLGASAISQFPQGYAQNASATSKYSAAIDTNSFAIARGHEFSPDDKMRAAIIESLMCNFDVRIDEMVSAHAVTRHDLYQMFARVNQKFEYILDVSESGLSIPHAARPLTRMIAREFDAYQLSTMGHSSAI